MEIIVITSHHLPASFRPREVVSSGWNISLVSGPQMTGSRGHAHRGGVEILTRISSNITGKHTIIADSSSGFTHQAATWSLTSPSLPCPIHVTGVYVSPNGDRTEEFFNLLSQQQVFPSGEPHIYMGDFNAHTHSMAEDHVTPVDNLPLRIGDKHAPAGPDSSLAGAFSSSTQRGRLLLRLLQSTELIFLNGRFQKHSDSSIPYIFQRTNSSDTSIVDYICLGKRHFVLVKSCVVYNAHRTSSSLVSDHNPILLHLDTKSIPAPLPQHRAALSSPPRLLYRSARLKDPDIRTSFTNSSQHFAQDLLGPLTAPKAKAHAGVVTSQVFANTSNRMIQSSTEAFHRAADKHLSRARDWPAIGLSRAREITSDPVRMPLAQHSSPDPQKAQLSKNLSDARNTLRSARKSSSISTCLSTLSQRVLTAKRALRTHSHHQRQAMFRHTASADLSTRCGSRNLWPLLRSYETDHASSTLPLKIYSNASSDPRIWSIGPPHPRSSCLAPLSIYFGAPPHSPFSIPLQ